MCITEKGELFTWGCGTFGRLGHDSEEHVNTPTLVDALAKVCCGSGG